MGQTSGSDWFFNDPAGILTNEAAGVRAYNYMKKKRKLLYIYIYMLKNCYNEQFVLALKSLWIQMQVHVQIIFAQFSRLR